VDNPHNTLSSTLLEEVLHNFDHSGNPPHKLNLKVNDICLVRRKSKPYYQHQSDHSSHPQIRHLSANTYPSLNSLDKFQISIAFLRIVPAQ